MNEIRIKKIDDSFKIPIVMENEDGTETRKMLEFNFSVKDYNKIRNLMKKAESVTEKLPDGFTVEDIDKSVEQIKELFESIAPNKWEEFFDFIDGNVEYMSLVIQGVLEKILDKAVKNKQAEILPEVPKDAEEV